jgi:hypothetical protein
MAWEPLEIKPLSPRENDIFLLWLDEEWTAVEK